MKNPAGIAIRFSARFLADAFALRTHARSATPSTLLQRRQPKRYTVRSGDTPSSIADKTGIPLEQILQLNPDLDPQTLSPGQRIKLRQ